MVHVAVLTYDLVICKDSNDCLRYLYLLCNALNSHGYLSTYFMKTALVPIVKAKTGATSDNLQDQSKDRLP